MVLDLHCPPPPPLQVIKISFHRSDRGHNFINDLSDFLLLCQFLSPREVATEFPTASRSLIGFSFSPTDLSAPLTTAKLLVFIYFTRNVSSDASRLHWLWLLVLFIVIILLLVNEVLVTIIFISTRRAAITLILLWLSTISFVPFKFFFQPQYPLSSISLMLLPPCSSQLSPFVPSTCFPLWLWPQYITHIHTIWIPKYSHNSGLFCYCRIIYKAFVLIKCYQWTIRLLCETHEISLVSLSQHCTLECNLPLMKGF